MSLKVIFADSDGCSIEDTNYAKRCPQTVDLIPYCRSREKLRHKKSDVKRIRERDEKSGCTGEDSVCLFWIRGVLKGTQHRRKKAIRRHSLRYVT